MKFLELTQIKTRKRILLRPDHYIIHQPRKTILIIEGKPAFRNTALMSVFAPAFCEQVTEGYNSVKNYIHEISSDFAELRHRETGTLFLFKPEYFELLEPGTIFPAFPEVVEQPSLVSLFNPTLWVPVSGTYEEIANQLFSL